MKRLGIFVFYDTEGIVDDYVEALLAGLKPEITELVIVANGCLTDGSEDKLAKYASRIFVRDNIGFDAGAYKDTILTYLNDEKWEQWDEIVLFNDTFYGPIFPFKDVFDRMDACDVDFWGLSVHPGGTFISDFKTPRHIQSYFLVCRKQLVMSNEFRIFWQTLSYPKTHDDAIKYFETEFTTYLTKQGFSYATYMELCCSDWEYKNGKDASICQSYDLIKQIGFPILKRRALFIDNFYQTREALEYIDKCSDYDIKLIQQHLSRYAKVNSTNPFNLQEIEKFYYAHNRIFIYGHGKYGNKVANYFEYRRWKYEGFIVSLENAENDFVYDKMIFQRQDGVILALGKAALEEVYKVIKKDIGEVDFFFPMFK